MTAFADYENYDGLGLAELVRQSEVTPEALLEAAIARIEAQNPALNAVVHKLYDQARRAIAAGLPEGPFTGVPYLLKDLYTFYEGAPCGNGSRLYAGFVAGHTDEMVRRAQRAGLVILGKTNTPEFGLSVSTEPTAHGSTHNPWDRSRTAGGSSGGAAAAVAAGMVPLANASDGGGSIRIPASACGLFGLKPTRARNPSGEGWAGLAVQHAVTRSVRDSAALLDATSGPLPGYPYCAPPPARPFLAEVGVDPGRLRIAWSSDGHPDFPPHSDCRAALEAAATLAAELGHEVEEAAPDIDYVAARRAMGVIVGASTAADLAAGHPLQDRPVAAGDVERLTWYHADYGAKITGAEYVAAVATVQDVGLRLGRFFETYDALLTPTLGQPPLRIGELDPESEDCDAVLLKLLAFIPFTQRFNMSGQPAASLPLHWNGEGLPIGVQLATRFGDEATLLSLASQFEAVRPWFDRRPELGN